MIGLCPFHNEKTPSFTVSPTKGIYKCFGCGKAGNSVNFLIEHEHFSYPEALKYLARKYHIEVEEEFQTTEQLQELGEKESLFNLNQFAQQYFSGMLYETEEGKAVGMSYLRERGIREDLIRKFQLGFSPDKRDSFSKYALEQGYKKEFLLKTGLSLEKDSRLYDRFHSRIVFPVHTVSGRIIGFGGRVLGADKIHPKYINSPESDIYNKSKSLYGIYQAQKTIISKDNCYLVEGYTDVISLHQVGIENVVASSGTSLTHDQIRIIQRYTTNITILYDGDPAGIKASFRGIDLILEQGMNVKIVLFPDGEDPDSFSQKHHPAEVTDFVLINAVNFILFKTKLLLQETLGDPIRKAALIKEIVNTIALIPDGISRSLYVKECSDIMSVSEQILFNELNKIRRKKYFKSPLESVNFTDIPEIEQTYSISPFEIKQETLDFQECEIIRILLLYGEEIIHIKGKKIEPEGIPVMVADYIVHEIQRDDLFFENSLFSRIFDIYVNSLENDTVPGRPYFLSHEDTEIARCSVNLIFTPYELSINWAKNNIIVETEEMRLRLHVEHGVLSFKAKKLEKLMEENRKRFQEAITPDEERKLLQEWQELKKSSIKVYKDLGRIITR